MDGLSLKQYFMRAASATGLGAAVRNTRWRQQRLAILCYHGISLYDEHVGLPSLYMTETALRLRMQYLRQNDFNVLPLSEAITALYSGTLPPRSVAVTFDDGTRDFAERAVPILCEMEIPATVYLTTFYCENRWPVFNTASRYLVARARGTDLDLADICDMPALARSTLETEEACSDACAIIRCEAKRMGLSAAQKHELLHKLAVAVGVEFNEFMARGQFQIMSPEQVAALPQGIIDVELHTHRHRMPQDSQLFEREIRDNKESITRATNGRSPKHFCYPSGEYGKIFLPWLDRLGVQSATTCVPGLASRHSHPLLLPRFIDTMDATEDDFASWLDGTSEWLPRSRSNRLDLSR